MKKFIWPVITVVICVVIFYFSAQNGNDSTGISDRFVNPIEGILANIFSRDFLILLVRKGAHISVYFLLGISAFLSMRKLWVSTIFCFLYACSDEIHQLFVEGRSGSVIDVGIDAIGFIIGGILVYEIVNFIKLKNRENTDEKHCKNNNNLV